MPIAGISYVDRAEVLQEARRLARQLREEHPEIRRAILFGSFARGAGGPRSDLDVVLIVDHTKLRPRDRLAHYLPVSTRPIDLFVYTSAELDRMRASPPPVLREALTRGVDLLPSD